MSLPQAPTPLPPMFWFCTACRAEGSVDFRNDITVKDAIEELRAMHAKASPQCSSTMRQLRILDADSLQKLKWRLNK